MAIGSTDTVIELPKLNLQRVNITLIGDSPLICHAWSQKAKEEILFKQMKRAKGQKEAKDPWREDNRRRPNGMLFLLTASAAAAHPVSRQWKGYWQRQGAVRQ